MDVKQHVNILALLALILLTSYGTRVQSQVTVDAARKLQAIQTDFKKPEAVKANQNKSETQPDLELSENQKTLVEGSKRALLKTGMSEPFFDQHFRVVKVIDKPGDKRVVWKMAVNEYEATVNDSIGYHTQGQKQVNIHSVQNLLSSTTDIKRTIPRARALRIMRACLGRFADAAVEYRAAGSGKAGLFLTASSVPRVARLSRKEVRERERKRSERESQERALQDRQGPTDVVDEEEEDERPRVFIASVNLETGKCVKGIAQAGPPKIH
jgi:hypothetical protein